MEAEGWYQDPFGQHECRWFSAGAATDLIRDGNQVGHDAPPDEPPPQPLVAFDDGEADVPESDLRRAADAQDGSTVDKGTVARKVARVMLNPGDTDFW